MRKHFQPGANVPMGTETYQRLALELHATCATLIERPSVDAYNQMSKMLAALASAGMVGEAMDLGTGALSDICDRYERVGKIGVSDIEAEQLGIAVASIDTRLPLIPVNRLDRAIAQVEIYCATVGA